MYISVNGIALHKINIHLMLIFFLKHFDMQAFIFSLSVALLNIYERNVNK